VDGGKAACGNTLTRMAKPLNPLLESRFKQS
jgi:hypothetical protein